jgi:hypothetical protein
MISYKYVKVTDYKGRTGYAYQRTILWLYKDYLRFGSREWAYNLTYSDGEFRGDLVRSKLEEVKHYVDVRFRRYKVTIQDAETKLDKLLNE